MRCSGIGVRARNALALWERNGNTPCAPQPFRTNPDGRRPLNCAAPRAALRVPRAGRHGALCALRACPGADLSVLCAAPDADLSVLHAVPDADLSDLRAALDAASCVLNAARYRASFGRRGGPGGGRRGGWCRLLGLSL